jgi:class 3 adenylate cyclase
LVVRVALLLAMLLASVPSSLAQAVGRGAAMAPMSMAVDAAAPDVALMSHSVIIKDETRNKSVDQAFAQAMSGPSSRVNGDVFSTGFSSAAYWFIVPLDNRGTAPLQRLLVFEPSWLDDVQLTLIDARGQTQTFNGGDRHPFVQRSQPSRLINFDVALQPGTNWLVVRTQTRDPLFVNLRLTSGDRFGQFAAKEALYYGLVYGGLLALLVFNLVLSLSSREKAYFAYCCLLSAFVGMHLTYNGHLFRWVIPDWPEVNNWAHSVLIYLYCFCGLAFALIFLDLKTKLPGGYRWTRYAMLGMALCFATSALLGGYRWHVITSIVSVIFFVLLAFTLALFSLRGRTTAAILYLNGSAAGLIGAALTALTVLGIVDYTFWTFRAVDFGILVDATMLSLALSARIAQARRLERLRRFFSPAVADKLLAATTEELYRPHHREIVVLFLDLRGYTAFTQTHRAAEVMEILSEFHAAMGALIHVHEATLERFAGDGMMIFLNDPVEIPDSALRGARMAIEMQTQFRDLNAVWKQRNYSLSMGIGIAQGMATIGAIGFEGRRDYAAIGNVTNLAARLCSEAAGGQILVSAEVAANVEGSVTVCASRALALKGFVEPVQCHEIMASVAAASQQPALAPGSIGVAPAHFG